MVHAKMLLSRGLISFIVPSILYSTRMRERVFLVLVEFAPLIDEAKMLMESVMSDENL